MALLEIKNLNFTYNGTEKPALQGINLTVEPGDFVLVCGESGCGKTTLLKLIKRELRPVGELTGEMLYQGIPIEDLDERTSASGIGYVMQNPENQTVTDKVWHELAFGLESLGESSPVIRRKVAEICGFFGIGDRYRKRICDLSGGEKQLIGLASVMVMNPSLLILDEPTAQLDPIAASDFLASLRKINEELGVTVIIAEHRLEEVFSMANRVVLMDKARIFLSDTPRAVGRALADDATSHKMALAMPAAVRLYHALNGAKHGHASDIPCPINVKEGKHFLSSCRENAAQSSAPVVTSLLIEAPALRTDSVALEITDGYFRYERQLPDVLTGLSLKVYENEFLCILGANGAGKTTLLRVLSGVRRLYKGKYRLWDKKLKAYTNNTLYRGNIACLPQNPQNLFVKNTVKEDLTEVTKLLHYPPEKAEAAIQTLADTLEISDLMDHHPYDLSGGEQQKAALAKILLMKPKIILLDEPTKGLDAYAKKALAELLISLKAKGKTIVMVTHDIEFAASYADRCAMFFDGQIVSEDNRIDFFATNRYYTTAAVRMTRHLFENAVTVDMAVELCRRNGWDHPAKSAEQHQSQQEVPS